MSDVDLERELERLRAATDAIEPDDAFTDAILRAAEADADRDPLAGLAQRTESIEAPEAIVDAVMARVKTAETRGADVLRIDAKPRKNKPRAPSWTDGVTRTGPLALGLALAAAAAGVLFFVSTQRDADATIATAVEAVEVIE